VYQTPVSWALFVGGVICITILTGITVSFESLKASLSDPVKALGYDYLLVLTVDTD